jgi:hypothetical protein
MDTSVMYASLAASAKSMMGFLEGLARKRRKGSVNNELSSEVDPNVWTAERRG